MKQILNKRNVKTLGSDSLTKYEDELSKEKYSPVDQQTTEKMIAMFKQGDHNARNILINRNLRFAFLVAKNYQHVDRPLIELISCANLGLIKVVDRSSNYDSSKGSWTTYIVSYIQGAILTEFFSKKSLIKKPKDISLEILSIGYANAESIKPEIFHAPNLTYVDRQNKMETESFTVDLRRILELDGTQRIYMLFLKEGILVAETLNRMAGLVSEYKKEVIALEEKSEILKSAKQLFSSVIKRKKKAVGEEKAELEANYRILQQSILKQELSLRKTREKCSQYKLFLKYFSKNNPSFYLERKDSLRKFLPEIFGVSNQHINQEVSRALTTLRRRLPSSLLRKYLGTDSVLEGSFPHN